MSLANKTDNYFFFEKKPALSHLNSIHPASKNKSKGKKKKPWLMCIENFVVKISPCSCKTTTFVMLYRSIIKVTAETKPVGFQVRWKKWSCTQEASSSPATLCVATGGYQSNHHTSPQGLIGLWPLEFTLQEGTFTSCDGRQSGVNVWKFQMTGHFF